MRLMAHLHGLSDIHQGTVSNALCALVKTCLEGSDTATSDLALWSEWMREESPSGAREVVVSQLCAFVTEIAANTNSTASMLAQENCCTVFGVLQLNAACASKQEAAVVATMCACVLRASHIHPCGLPLVYGPLIRAAALDLMQRTTE